MLSAGLKTHKNRFRPEAPGLRPGPHWVSLHCSPRPPNWWAGGQLPPSPRTSPPPRPLGPRASALWASRVPPHFWLPSAAHGT